MVFKPWGFPTWWTSFLDWDLLIGLSHNIIEPWYSKICHALFSVSKIASEPLISPSLVLSRSYSFSNLLHFSRTLSSKNSDHRFAKSSFLFLISSGCCTSASMESSTSFSSSIEISPFLVAPSSIGNFPFLATSSSFGFYSSVTLLSWSSYTFDIGSLSCCSSFPPSLAVIGFCIWDHFPISRATPLCCAIWSINSMILAVFHHSFIHSMHLVNSYFSHRSSEFSRKAPNDITSLIESGRKTPNWVHIHQRISLTHYIGLNGLFIHYTH